MGKRFTETEKWKDKWFRALPPEMKLAWMYLLDNCDAAGIIEVDEELANFQIGEEVNWQLLISKAGDRIQVLQCGKVWLTKFVKYQYGKLSVACKPHAPAIAILERYGLNPEQAESYKHGSVTAERRKKVMERDGFECCYCGAVGNEQNIVVDHVVPKSGGGSDSDKNLVAACTSCNMKKSDRSVIEFIDSLSDPSKAYQRLSERLSSRLLQSLQEKEKERNKEKEQGKEQVSDGYLGPERPGMWQDFLKYYFKKTGKDMDSITEMALLSRLWSAYPDPKDHDEIILFTMSVGAQNLILNGNHKNERFGGNSNRNKVEVKF